MCATPEVRRAQRLLHKIDDSVRNISQRQEDMEQVRKHTLKFFDFTECFESKAAAVPRPFVSQ